MASQEENTTKTIIDNFIEAGQAIADTVELGVLKVWNVKKDENTKKISASESKNAGRLSAIELKITDRGDAKVFLGFSGLNYIYEPFKFGVTKVNGCSVGIFFSKEDAEASLMKEIKERLEKDLTKRMQEVNELKASIEKLDAEIAKVDKV